MQPNSFPSVRVRAAVLLAGVFLGINLLTRLALAILDWPRLDFATGPLLETLLIGLVNDVAVASVFFAFLAVLALPFRSTSAGRIGHGAVFAFLAFALLFGMVFVAYSEWLFWNEFSGRFNFIAVDYLIYTREVVGNIQQSYSMPLVFGGIGAAVMVLMLLFGRRLWTLASGPSQGFKGRLVWSLLSVALAAGLLMSTANLTDSLDDGRARELAGNGYRAFVRAFRNNDLDFARYYPTLDETKVRDIVREEFAEAHSTAVFADRGHPLERNIESSAPPKQKNVVLVSIESLGADYLGVYGDKRGLTPNLDALAEDSLLFTKVYATGLRTVRGLEALTLSVPPTPGRAVPVRPDHSAPDSLGEVFERLGYEALYIYGGYSYFDNMERFFSDNGYTVVDRTDIDPKTISHETIWGVADEDLYEQALLEIDHRAESGQRVFAHIMTTSNHRPYTYAEGRIDIPPGTGRDGAVKYTDYAIGKFMREASQRPWFKDTLFVIVADHTSRGRGRTDLPAENYHIPLMMYAPGWLKPGSVEQLASQIDVGPTILGLLGVSYTSQFFGQDILTEGLSHQRAFMANYLTVGYMEDGMTIELAPKGRSRVFRTGEAQELPLSDPAVAHVMDEAISYYQMASALLARGEAPARVAGASH